MPASLGGKASSKWYSRPWFEIHPHANPNKIRPNTIRPSPSGRNSIARFRVSLSNHNPCIFYSFHLLVVLIKSHVRNSSRFSRYKICKKSILTDRFSNKPITLQYIQLNIQELSQSHQPLPSQKCQSELLASQCLA